MGATEEAPSPKLQGALPGRWPGPGGGPQETGIAAPGPVAPEWAGSGFKCRWNRHAGYRERKAGPASASLPGRQPVRGTGHLIKGKAPRDPGGGDVLLCSLAWISQPTLFPVQAAHRMHSGDAFLGGEVSARPPASSAPANLLRDSRPGSRSTGVRVAIDRTWGTLTSFARRHYPPKSPSR